MGEDKLVKLECFLYRDVVNQLAVVSCGWPRLTVVSRGWMWLAVVSCG